MGWTSSYSWKTKQDVMDEVLSSTYWGKKINVLKHSLRGNCLWVLAEHTREDLKGKNQFISLFLLSKNDGCYAYKPMDESCGPYYYNCPLTYIDSVEKHGGEVDAITRNWRQSVKDYHQNAKLKKQAVKSLAPGMKLKLYGVVYGLIRKHSGRKGWEVQSLSDGCFYRMTCKQVSSAELVTS